MYVIIPTTLVCVFFDIAISTSPFNFLQFFFTCYNIYYSPVFRDVVCFVLFCLS